MIEALAKLIKKVDTRVTNLVKLGRVSRFLEDNREIPIVQATYLGDITGNVAVILPFGMSAGLPEDTLGIVLNSGTDRLFIPFSTGKRVKNLKRNETAIGYGDQKTNQTYIKFDEEGNIIIKTSKIIKIQASDVEVDGNLDLTVNGNVNVTSGTAGTVTIDASQINLGIGGGLAKIARVGDKVTTDVGGTNYDGYIVEGGTNESI